MYAPSAPVNLISTGQLEEDGIGSDTHKGCFVHKALWQDVAKVTWIGKVPVFTIQDPPVDEHLVQYTWTAFPKSKPTSTRYRNSRTKSSTTG